MSVIKNRKKNYTPKISKIKKILWGVKFGHSKIKKDTVLFLSFEGMYNDNPKYISLKLHEMYPELSLIWARSNKGNAVLPEYITTVEYGSKEYYKWTYQANVIVDNYLGIRSLESRNHLKRIVKHVLSFFAPIKKKGQYNISTWHGTPLKKCGMDSVNGSQTQGCTARSADCVLSGCEFTRYRLETAYLKNLQIPFKMYGTPRNDVFFDETVSIEELKNKLNLPLSKKIILFAPTFRDDSIDFSGINQLNDFDFDEIFHALERKFNGDWCFVFRVHHTVLNRINFDNLYEKYGDRFMNGNLHDDMSEYLICSDILLTDYSSSMFDFLLSRRPCFLYVPDKEHYEQQERGFYLDVDSLPFLKAINNEQLIKAINDFDNEKYLSDVESFLDKMGNVEDGKAAKRVAEDIVFFLQTGLKR